VGVVTALEEAIIRAARCLNQSHMGEWLRENHPGRRAGPGSSPGLTLDKFELNAGLPVYRTLSVLGAAKATRRDLNLTDADQSYVSIVEDIQVALRAISDRFWGTIRTDVRTLIYDHDDVPVPFLGQPYISGLRQRRGPSLQTACARVGLSEHEIAVLAGCWHAAHSTDAYEAARASSIRVQLYDNLRRRLIARRSELTGRAESVMNQGVSLGDAARQVTKLVEAAYDDSDLELQGVAIQLRAYNELVQAVLWALLGFAEGSDDAFTPLPVDHSRVGVEHSRRHLIVHLTTFGARFGISAKGGPFVIRGRGPLDGIYLCQGTVLRAIGQEWGLTDLTGLKFSELEQAG
jgi:hypothetical protein